MHMPTWFTTSLAVGAVAMAAGAPARHHALVRDGGATSRIVLSKTAGPVETHAAAELARYLQKVSGAKVETRSTPARGLYNIYVGVADAPDVPLSGAMKAAASGIAPHGFMLAADEQGLRIVGRRPIGVLYGAYAVLKTYAGVRWFAPGADYEYCPRKPTVVVPEQVVVSNPSFRFRYVGFVCANWNSKTNDTWDWMVRNGLTLRASKHLYKRFREEMDKRGAEIHYGGHSFAFLLSDDLFGAHPEYFALIDGKRVRQRPEPRGAARRQPCTSNPKVVDTMAASLARYLDLAPKGGAFLIGNNDGTAWCQCENCTRIDPPIEKQKRFVSTRYYTLVNHVAAKVYTTHPHADIWSWAYQNYQYPPTGVVPDKRLTISVCVHYRCYRHPIRDESCVANARFRDILPRWMTFGNPVITREYDECFGGEPPYLPVEDVMAQDIRYYHKLGLSGFTPIVAPPDGKFGPKYNTRGIKEAWYATWQMRYLAAQLAWDVNADYPRLVEDMGSTYYGPAWPAMKPYREQLVEMYEDTPGDICYGTPAYILGKCLERPGVEARLLRLLGKAETLAVGDPVALARVRRDREYFGMCWQTLHKEFLAKRQHELNVNPRTGAIAMDGKLDEPDWKGADFTTGFVATDGKTVANPQTFVRMLYDKQNIYFAIESMEPDPGTMRVKVSKRDGPVWSDSSVEVFVAAPGMGGRYAQVVVNPRRAVYDSLSTPSQQADIAFDSHVEVGTAVQAGRWVAEIRLPVAGLGRTIGHGEAWKINVGRNHRPVDGPRQSSSWSHGVFHGPDAYRTVVFGSTALLRNGDFEDAVEPNKYQKRTRWVFVNNTVPVRWAFHSGQPGTAALVRGDAASGRRYLRLTNGWIHQKINQAADYRKRLVIRCKARGHGTLGLAMYRYHRPTGKHVSTVGLKQVTVDSTPWVAVTTAYTCGDDKVLRLAFHVKGQVDLDDVTVTQDTGP